MNGSLSIIRVVGEKKEPVGPISDWTVAGDYKKPEKSKKRINLRLVSKNWKILNLYIIQIEWVFSYSVIRAVRLRLNNVFENKNTYDQSSGFSVV